MDERLKQPSEVLEFEIPAHPSATTLMGFGYAIDHITVTVLDPAGEDVSGEMVVDSRFDAENRIFVIIRGGEDGRDYSVKAVSTWQLYHEPDQALEHDLILKVRQIGF